MVRNAPADKSLKFVRPRSTQIAQTLLLSLGLLIVLLGTCLFSLSVGTVSIGFLDVIRSLIAPGNVSESIRAIIVDIRLPRILLAVVVGAGLSTAGVTFQALLRNPLAEPFILGISSGASVGAILTIVLGIGFTLISTPFAAFLGSLLVMVIVYTIGHRRGQLDTSTLLLAGVMTGAFFNAMILLFITMFGREMRTAFLWLLGNLSSAEMKTIFVIGPLTLIAFVVLYFHAHKLNLIATGEEVAMQLGVEVERVKRTSYLLASFITGIVVSASGIIGFVGLIVPHVCRMVIGPDHRVLLPISLLAGGTFLVVADLVWGFAVVFGQLSYGQDICSLGPV